MKYKIILCALFTLALIWLMAIPSFAEDTATVYAKPVEGKSGETVVVPVYIQNNPGLMGFRITVGYDSEQLTAKSVSKGTVTDSGMINDSIGVSEAGTFDIVWNHTEDVKKDGTIVVLFFTCQQDVSEPTPLKFGYSQEDTFNEQYEDVLLDFSADESMQTSNETTISREVTPDDIVLAVETVQGDLTSKTTPQDMDAINDVLSQITGQSDPYFNNTEAIMPAYHEALQETYVEEVLDAVGASKVQSIIQETLREIGVKSVDEVPNDQIRFFVDQVDDALCMENNDLSRISDQVGLDEGLQVLLRLYERASKGVSENKTQSENTTALTDKKTIILILCSIFGVLFIALIGFFGLKSFRKCDKKG